jgi:hypothetical protein
MRKLFRHGDGQVNKNRVLLAGLLGLLVLAAGITLMFLPSSQPKPATIALTPTGNPDTAVVYETTRAGGAYQTTLVGTYVWQADGDLSLASQLFDNTATRAKGIDGQRITMTLRPGQTVTGAYACYAVCNQPTAFSSTSGGATVVSPTGTFIVVLVQGGWSPKPGNAQLIATAGLKLVSDEAMGRKFAYLGEFVSAS